MSTVDEPLHLTREVISEFEYQPLAPGHIRLIKVANPNLSERLRNLRVCRITHHAVDEAPKYIAMSYTWGDGAQQCEVFANGQRLTVTENLQQALSAFTDILEREDLHIWIDAICINQKDNLEKASQVQLMKSIYDNASDVFAWLGPQTKYSDIAIDALQDLYQLFQSYWEERKMTTEELVRKGFNILVDVDRVRALAQCEKEDPVPHEDVFPVFHGVCTFLQSPWWKRTWIIQEATGPKRPFLWIGHTGMRWDMSTAFHMFLIRAIQYPNYHYLRRLIQPHATRLQLLRESQENENGTKLLDLLDEFRVFEATDPRDKVFALLAISSDMNDCDDLRPDFTISVEEVYMKTATAIIEYESDPQRKFDILGCCSGSMRGNGLPSWVPDWRPGAHWNRVPFVKTNKDIVDGSVESTYNAASFYVPSVRVEDRVLYLDGCFLDVLDILSDPAVGKAVGGVGKDLSFEWNWISLLGTDQEELEKKKYFTDESMLQAFVSTVVADMDWRGGKPFDRGNFWRSMEMIQDKGIQLKDLSADAAVGELVEKELVHLLPEHTIQWRRAFPTGDLAPYLDITGNITAEDVVQSLRSATLGRRLAVSLESKLLCLVPADAEPSDIICCVLGAPVFYCLRLTDPEGEDDVADASFELIGEVYVHGYMDSELELNDKDIRTIKIV